MVGVFGAGATGLACITRLLRRNFEVVAYDQDPSRQEILSALVTSSTKNKSNGGSLEVRDFVEIKGPQPAIVVLALPTALHLDLARQLLDRGSSIISVGDGLSDVRGLLALDQKARDSGLTVLVGAGFAPGITCLLARHAANQLDVVDEIMVAKVGTGGPACAREHHHALKKAGLLWSEGSWLTRAGGSGRNLAWFPGTIGSRDCYRAALASPLLLQRSFPDARRIGARVSATRRDRFTARLPMLRPPHADGGPGAIRVEVRGRRQDAVETIVYGAVAHPSVAAGEMAAACVVAEMPPGAMGLSDSPDPKPLLRSLLQAGIGLAVFEGVSAL